LTRFSRIKKMTAVSSLGLLLLRSIRTDRACERPPEVSIGGLVGLNAIRCLHVGCCRFGCRKRHCKHDYTKYERNSVGCQNARICKSIVRCYKRPSGTIQHGLGFISYLLRRAAPNMELKMLNRSKFSLRGARAATISTIRRASGSAIADLCLVLWGRECITAAHCATVIQRKKSKTRWSPIYRLVVVSEARPGAQNARRAIVNAQS
jgi:hypothetical protein